MKWRRYITVTYNNLYCTLTSIWLLKYLFLIEYLIELKEFELCGEHNLPKKS